MPRARRALAVTLGDLLMDVAGDLQMQGGLEAPVQPDDGPPLWMPYTERVLQPGRGILLPEGSFDEAALYPGQGIREPGGWRRMHPQQAAIATYADELFFGGGPGGGKSQVALGLALTRHRNSIIFRAEFTQLRGAEGLWEKARGIIGDRGRSNENLWTYRDLPGGRAIEFGAAHTFKDMRKYQGRPHDLKAFDEITEFPEGVYRFLNAWLRTAYLGQRTRVVCTGNPPVSEEGQWVLTHWAPWLDRAHPDPARPGELRWYVSDPTTQKDREVPGPKWGPERAPKVLVGKKPDGSDHWVEPRSRTFIGSQVEDNPAYVSTGYTHVLDNLPEELRALMRFSDFSAARQDHERQVIPTEWVVQAQARWSEERWRSQPLARAGCDPSRGGKDEFVVAPLHGDCVGPLKIHAAKDAPDGPAGSALVFLDLEGDTSAPVHIDVCGGAGTSVYDYCRDLKLRALPMDGSAASRARVRDRHGRPGNIGFKNKRAEWHWRMREALDPMAEVPLALPPDPQLRSDLCAPRWELQLGKIRIEEKDEIKARLGRSPDRGEAVIYAVNEAGGDFAVLFTGTEKAKGVAPSLEDEVAALRQKLGLG